MKKPEILKLIALLICCELSIFSVKHSGLHAQNIISLAGDWQFQTDRDDVGLKQKWQDRELLDHILLPGSMPENGKGDDPTVHTPWVSSLYDSSFYFNPYMERYRREGETVKFPFFLTPQKHYVGVAWYRRQIYIPQAWDDQRVLLYLERPHIETTVFVNGHEAGHGNSLSVAHEFDLTRHIKPGRSNTIAIRVDNRIDGVCVGQDSHSVTDQTQGDWNGIVGRMELQATPNHVWIERVRVFPNLAEHKVLVETKMSNRLGEYDEPPYIRLIIEDPEGEVVVDHEGMFENDHMVFMVPMGQNMKLWDEFHPNLYHLTLSVDGDTYETDFGMREISVKGRQMYLNNRPIWLRGTVENCTFPLTGYPPMEEDEWERIFRQCKAYGLNHIRFHSYCPPEAAFAVADRLGLYLQPEGPTWANHGVKLGAGMAIDKYLMDETQRILDAYGNHPSFTMMASGNEPAGNWVPYTNKWVTHWQEKDPRRLYCGASVGGGWAWDSESQYHVKGGGRGLDWSRHAPSSDDNYLQDILRPRNYKGEADNNSPIVAHEQGQWCAFPDLDERRLYTGVNKAYNFDIFADLLRSNGMASQARNFLMASGRLQKLCYKYEIERNLRTPDYSGFQLLGLNDYSGQGTALEGVLNVFWREKGYCTAQEWRQFCSPIVPLARFPRFVYSSADTLRVPVELYNAYRGTLVGFEPSFFISDQAGNVLHQGKLKKQDVPLGKNTQLGTVEMPLQRFSQPIKLTLTVAASRGQVRNSWDFWVYPQELTKVDSEGIYIAQTLDETAKNVLARGGKVLLTAAGKVTMGNDIRQTYLPVFWNTSWFKMRPPHTTGAYIHTEHPLFKHFLSDDWANLNWWELLNRAQVILLSDMPADYQSPVQPIDTWHLSRKLGMIVEAQVGKGRLFMTTMDIDSHLSQRLVARQMRHAILTYMQSPDFKPTLKLSADRVADFFTRTAPKVDMHTNDSPDELKPKLQ